MNARRDYCYINKVPDTVSTVSRFRDFKKIQVSLSQIEATSSAASKTQRGLT